MQELNQVWSFHDNIHLHKYPYVVFSISTYFAFTLCLELNITIRRRPTEKLITVFYTGTVLIVSITSDTSTERVGILGKVSMTRRDSNLSVYTVFDFLTSILSYPPLVASCLIILPAETKLPIH
jgi:hypothetical protein